MSMFTKRRKVMRQKQEYDRLVREENFKKFDKTCRDIISTCEYIQENHPEFEELDGEDRVKLFGDKFNELHNN